MVRRIVSISFIVWAVVMMMAAGLVPHHHHDAAVCMASHTCSAVHDDPEGPFGHEGHDHGCPEDRSETPDSCVAHASFVDRLERDKECHRALCDHGWHIHLWVVPVVSDAVEPTCVDLFRAAGDTPTPPLLAAAHSSVGLRAPPFFLC